MNYKQKENTCDSKHLQMHPFSHNKLLLDNLRKQLLNYLKICLRFHETSIFLVQVIVQVYILKCLEQLDFEKINEVRRHAGYTHV